MQDAPAEDCRDMIHADTATGIAKHRPAIQPLLSGARAFGPAPREVIVVDRCRNRTMPASAPVPPLRPGRAGWRR